MRNKKAIDERVLLERRKIGSDAFQILFFGLIISVLIQQFINDAPFIQYAYKFVLFIVVSIYIIFRNLLAGNDMYSEVKSNRKMNFINSVVMGLIVAISNTLLREDISTYSTFDVILIGTVTFISAILFAYICLEAISFLSKKRQQNIEAKLDSE